ncbi:MAG: hypothetical protein R3E83_23040 [Burkholderiaceae bacterium]
MSQAVPFEAGGYAYLPAYFQYSGGVAALPGHAIERVVFARPLPLAEAFAFIEAHLNAIGRPFTAFAQCELRSAEPFTDQGFIDFNRGYVGKLAQWGIFRDEINPVARTNVCPRYGAPSEPSMAGFAYTVAAGDGRQGGFMISGGGDARAGSAPYAERIVALHDTSPEGLREKVRFVVGSMKQRLSALGCDWSQAEQTRAYTDLDIGALVGEELAAHGVVPQGLCWHYARPPVKGLAFEMDVAGALDVSLRPVR